jgi:hypothetical protein
MTAPRKPWPTFRRVFLSLLAIDAVILAITWLARQLTAI